MLVQNFKGCFSEVAMFEVKLVDLRCGNRACRGQSIPEQGPAKLQHFVCAGGERAAGEPGGDASHILRVQDLQLLRQQTNLLQFAAGGTNGGARLSESVES